MNRLYQVLTWCFVLVARLSMVKTSGEFKKYEIYTGRSIDTEPEFYLGIESPLRCAVLVSAKTPSNESTLALYNEVTNNCEKYPVDQTTYLLYDGANNSVVYWTCDSITSANVYYEYVDSDLGGFDLTIQYLSTRSECANFCEDNYGDDSKGFLYQYVGTGSKRCICKSISVEDFNNEGYSLSYASGYSYYDRLCSTVISRYLDLVGTVGK